MKISIFTSMTNPEERNDPWEEALNCYKDFADEVIVVGEDWPEEFLWDHIGKTFQQGLDKSNGDWAIRMDLDYFFHENDMNYIKNFLKENNEYPAVAFPKRQFFTVDRFQLQSRVCIAVNKKKYPEIKLNGGGDLCFPTLNDEDIDSRRMPLSSAPVWNYDMMFKTKEIIAKERVRFGKAWYKYFDNWGIFGGETEEEAFDAWFNWIKDKYKNHVFKVKIDDHPKYIKDKLNNLKPNQFGYSAFNLKNEISPNAINIFRAYRNKYIYKFKS